jgi:hypothetical protein
MSKNNTEKEILKIFQKLEDENWVSESELAQRRYEMDRHKENCEQMREVRANRKSSMSGMKKPKGIDEWCD